MKYFSILLVSLFILTSCNSDQGVSEITNSGVIQSEVIQEIEVEIASGKIDEPETLTKVIEGIEGKPVPYSFYAPDGELISVYPISHATVVLEWGGKTLYIDPAEEKSAYQGLNDPDIIFITHVHGDHLQDDVLKTINSKNPEIVVPGSVNEELSPENQTSAIIMQANTTKEIDTFTITTVPAYNMREDALNYHPKDRNDNGYIIEKNEFRVYFAGDSEDTIEMRALENIDVAFLPMNLPYTMTVESAASAVLDFKPITVFPYHYRGTDGKSDIEAFKSIVDAGNLDIEVMLHDWYGE